MKCPNCGKEVREGLRFCENCGEEIARQHTPIRQSKPGINETVSEGAAKPKTSFCTKCGSRLNEKGKCPDCDALIRPTFKKKAKKVFTAAIIALSVYTVMLITVSALVYFDKLDIPLFNDLFISMGIKEPAVRPPEVPEVAENETEDDIENTDEPEETILTDQYSVTPPDAEEYFNNNSSVISVHDAGDMDTVLSEYEVYSLLSKRGFDGYEILTDYSIDGEFNDDTKISRYSSTKHPIYTTYYMTPDGDWWSILVVNDSIYANPISYNLQDAVAVPVVISETDEITSYDGTTNKFYISSPHEDVMRVKKVEQIDSETLDNLSKEGIAE